MLTEQLDVWTDAFEDARLRALMSEELHETPPERGEKRLEVDDSVLLSPEDRRAFDAWVASPAFAHGHRGAPSTDGDQPPVAAHSELWSYDVEIAVQRPS